MAGGCCDERAGLRMVLADPGRSRAVLIGTSRFTDPELPDLPAVRNNLDALAECLRDPARWGLPDQNCQVVADPDSLVALVDPIHEAAAAAEDTLLIYYAGHGLVHPRTLGLLLAVVGSSPGRSYTAVPYDEVRHSVIDSLAARKVVILDCCFSGRAVGGMADPASAVANEASVEGTYLLASAPPNKQSLSPPGETYTAFTGALLRILTDGVPDGPEYLHLDAIYRHVRDALRRAARPEPQLRVDNAAGELALVRNTWHRPAGEPTTAARPVRIEPSASPADGDRAQPQRGRTYPAPAGEKPAEGDRAEMWRRRAQWALSSKKLASTERPRQEQKHWALTGRKAEPNEPAEPETERRLTDEMVASMYNAPVRQRIRELAAAGGWFGCPACGVTVAGEDLGQHIDEHKSDEIWILDAASIALEPRDPDVGGRYRLGTFIDGMGSFRVRLATDLRTNRTVVIKPLPTEDQRARNHLSRAAKFDHPGIVRTLDIGTNYIVLEYVDGRPLSARYRDRGRVAIDDAAEIVALVCDALDYGHRRGVAHGNVTSGNILITRDGHPKLLNFGARELAADPTTIDSDTVAAGWLLLEIVAGRPVRGKEDTIVVPMLPDPLLRVTATMDHHLAIERYRSAADLAKALRRALREMSAPDGTS
jgi:hypothetical protein